LLKIEHKFSQKGRDFKLSIRQYIHQIFKYHKGKPHVTLSAIEGGPFILYVILSRTLSGSFGTQDDDG